MKQYALPFYSSKAWQRCRENYAKSKGRLCEICLAKGKIVPSEIVHHKIPISVNNVDDPNITLNWDNLQCVCRECHAALHKSEKRYKIDELGRVIITEETAPPVSST